MKALIFKKIRFENNDHQLYLKRQILIGFYKNKKSHYYIAP